MEKEQFDSSGHFRAYRQIIPKDSLHALVQRHEGQKHPELSNAPDETGCMQCHGTKIRLDENGRPTPDTWPNAGTGNICPDDSMGNCSTCHAWHKFSIAESRRPAACAPCHLGPDHLLPSLASSGPARTAGCMMGGPDWAHWHGFFELQQDLYRLEDIYNKRMASGKIED